MGLTMFVQNMLLFVGALVIIFILSWQLALCVLLVVPPVIWRQPVVPTRVEPGVPGGARAHRHEPRDPPGGPGRRARRAGVRARAAFTARFQETNEAQYDANLDDHPHLDAVLPVRRVLRRRRHRTDHRRRRPLRRPGHRHRRHRRRVRALPQQPVRADPAAQPDLQHGAVGRRGAEQALRAPRHEAVDRGAAGRGRPARAGRDRGRGRDVRVRRRARRAARRVARGRAGRAARARRSDRRRQVDAGQAHRPLLRPDEVGTVRFGGVDLRDATIRSLRERIVVVPQEGFLFAGTIRDNVRVGRPEATDAEVEAALDALGILERFEAAARRARHRGAGAGVAAVGGGAPAGVAGPGRARRPGGAGARRGDVEPRPGHRADGRARARAADRGAHGGRRRAPAVDRGARRPGRGGRRRAARWSSAPTTSSSAAKAATPASGPAGLPKPASPRGRCGPRRNRVTIDLDTDRCSEVR